MIPIEFFQILTPLQKLPKNVGDLEKLIVAKGFKKLPKVQQIAQSAHTDHSLVKQKQKKCYTQKIAKREKSASGKSKAQIISGQSYKQLTLVFYDSRVVLWGIFKSGMTLEL